MENESEIDLRRLSTEEIDKRVNQFLKDCDDYLILASQKK